MMKKKKRRRRQRWWWRKHTHTIAISQHIICSNDSRLQRFVFMFNCLPAAVALSFEEFYEIYQMVLPLAERNQLNKRLQPQSMLRNFINGTFWVYGWDGAGAGSHFCNIFWLIAALHFTSSKLTFNSLWHLYFPLPWNWGNWVRFVTHFWAILNFLLERREYPDGYMCSVAAFPFSNHNIRLTSNAHFFSSLSPTLSVFYCVHFNRFSHSISAAPLSCQ